MQAGFVAAGAGMIVLGVVVLAGAVPLLSRYLPDGGMVVLLAAGAILLIGDLVPRETASEGREAEDYRNMKRCHGCGKMVPPDTIRCPNCGAKFTSLYENL